MPEFDEETKRWITESDAKHIVHIQNGLKRVVCTAADESRRVKDVIEKDGMLRFKLVNESSRRTTISLTFKPSDDRVGFEKEGEIRRPVPGTVPDAKFFSEVPVTRSFTVQSCGDESIRVKAWGLENQLHFSCQERGTTMNQGPYEEVIEDLYLIGESASDHSADVIFFHGLDGDAIETWHPKGEPDSFWPYWLCKDFPNLRVWSVNYDSRSISWSKDKPMPLGTTANNILTRLTNAGIGKNPLILIGHSLGGLVCKQIMERGGSYDQAEWNELVENVLGIHFLATPHSGADIATWVSYFKNIVPSTNKIDELQRNEPRLRDLNKRFQKIVKDGELRVEICHETKPMGIGRISKVIVDEASADPEIPGAIPKPIQADHVQICKPESPKKLVYVNAKNFITTCLARLD